MKRHLLFKGLSIAAGLLTSSLSFGYSSYNTGLNNAIVTAYGSTAGYTASCAGCHGSSTTTTMANQWGRDFQDALYLYGANYTNILNAIKLLDSDGDGSTNEDEFKAKTNPADPASHPVACVRAAPTLSISPSSQSGLAGSSLSYSISVKNNDSAACPSSAFAVADTVPSGITDSLSLQSLVLTPGQTSTSMLTLVSDAGLAAGSYSFSVNVSESGVSIHSKSANGTLVVQAAPVCTRAAPSVSLSPSSQTAMAGDSKTFALKIVNNDSAACQSSSFDLALNAQAPLSGSLSGQSLMLAPGANGSVNVSVMSDAAAAAGSYSFSVAVSDAAEALHAGSASGMMIVQVPAPVDTAAPSIPMNLSSQILPHGRVQISWDASTDNVGVAKYQVIVDGSLKGEVISPTIKLRLRRGAHEVRVKALDAAGNVSELSAPLSITIQRR